MKSCPKRCVSYVSSWSCMATVWSCDKREICQGGREKLHRDFACDSGAAGRELTFSLFLAHQWKMEDSLWELVDEKISTIQTRVKSHNISQSRNLTQLLPCCQRMAVPSAPVSTLVRPSSTIQRIQRIRWESQDLRDFTCAVGCYLEYLDFVDLCWSLLDLKSRWNFWDFEVQPADDPKSGTVCYCCIRQYNRYQQLQQLRTAHWKLQLTVQGIQRRRRDALRTDLQMRTPQQFAAMKCSTAASLMPSKDVLPEVGRCAIFRSRELWHEMLTPRHRLWAAWQHQICAGYLFHNSKVNTRPVHHCSIYYNRILQILQVLTLFAYRAWRKKT